MTGLLNPKSWEIRKNKNVILVLYLGHGTVHPVEALGFLSQCLGEVLSSRNMETQKKRGSPLS